jgi:transcriptional regulator with XRE-family HTH domain
MGCVKRQLRFRAALRKPCGSIPLDPMDVHIGGRLRRTRIFRDLTRYELARGIGATEREVEAFESGATRIDAQQVRRIGRVLRVRPSFFLRSGRSEAAEPAASPRRESLSPSIGVSASERVVEIFESINNPSIRKLLVDLMLVITASEVSGRHPM